MRTMDVAVSTTDYLGSVDPDVAPGAEAMVDSSPDTAAAAAAAAAAAVAGVKVVSAPNREGIRDSLKHLFPAENLRKHHACKNTNGCIYMNMYVPEAAIRQCAH